MSWLSLILFSVVTYSFSVILQKILLKDDKKDPIVFSLVFQIITGTLIGIYAITTKQLVWEPINGLLPNMVLMTILYGVGNIFIFRSLQVVEASKFTILFATRGLFTVLAASLVFSERLELFQFLGAVLIVAGIIIVNIQNKKLEFKKNDLLAMLAALIFGIANTNDRYLLKSLNLYEFVFLSFILSGLFAGIIYRKRLSQLKEYFENKYWVKMLALSTIYAISAVLFFGALQKAPNTSQVAIINLTSTVLIAFLGIIILRERSNLLGKVIGAIISFAGLVLVTR